MRGNEFFVLRGGMRIAISKMQAVLTQTSARFGGLRGAMKGLLLADFRLHEIPKNPDGPISAPFA